MEMPLGIHRISGSGTTVRATTCRRHCGTCIRRRPNMLGELSVQAFGVRRQEVFDRGPLRNATIDRLAAEGAILASAQDIVNDVRHLTGADAAELLGVSKVQSVTDARALLTDYE